MIRAYEFREIEARTKRIGYDLIGVTERLGENNHIVLARCTPASMARYPKDPKFAVWTYRTSTMSFTDEFNNFDLGYAEDEFYRRATE